MNNNTSIGFTLPHVPVPSFPCSTRKIRSEAQLSPYFPRIEEQKCLSSTLKNVPYDALNNCFQFLPRDDLSRLGRTDRDFHKYENQFWKDKFLKNFGSFIKEEAFDEFQEDLYKILYVSLVEKYPIDFTNFQPLIKFLEGALKNKWRSFAHNEGLHPIHQVHFDTQLNEFLLSLNQNSRIENAFSINEFHTKMHDSIQHFLESLSPDARKALREKYFVEKFLSGERTLKQIEQQYRNRKYNIRSLCAFFVTTILLVIGIQLFNHFNKK